MGDFGSPGPIIDFRAPLTHTLVADNSRKKGTFENIFLEGRPPVSFGITSGGDLFGGTTVTLTDILGDQQFNFYAASISQYRTVSAKASAGQGIGVGNRLDDHEHRAAQDYVDVSQGGLEVFPGCSQNLK